MGYFSAVKERPERPRYTRRKVSSTGKPTEAAIQDSIMKYLHLQGWVVVRINSSALPNEKTGAPMRSYYIYGPGMSAGFPDLLALKGGQYLLFEVKTESGVISFTQQKISAYFEGRQVPIHYVASIDDVQRVLNGQQPERTFRKEKPVKRELFE